MELKLYRDQDGNILAYPMAAWGITPVAGMSFVLTISYAETPDKFEKGEHDQMQILLTALKAIELGEALRKTAEELLYPTPGGTVH